MENCSQRLSLPNSTTSSLYRHMLKKHHIEVPRIADLEVKEPASVQKTMTTFFEKKESFVAYMARLVVRTKIPFLRHTSAELHEIYRLKGYTCALPKSANTVREKVLGFAEEIRQGFILELLERRKTAMFSVTMDEWTSAANKRYMNVNIHCADRFWNLGLFRVRGSADTENCTQLLTDILHEHKLDIGRDIVGVTTDGASVMVKMGNYLYNQSYCNYYI